MVPTADHKCNVLRVEREGSHPPPKGTCDLMDVVNDEVKVILSQGTCTSNNRDIHFNLLIVN